MTNQFGVTNLDPDGLDWSVSGYLTSQVVKVHVPQDLLCNLFGPLGLVLLEHQIHRLGSVCTLQPRHRDSVGLRAQEVLEGSEIL